MLFSIYRRLLRNLLALLVKLTIKKHKPIIIVIRGEKNASILSDFLYVSALSKYNPRKALERNESEFAIPLTILGTLYYPDTISSWIKLILRSLMQLILIKPYKHLLILQIREITPEIYAYWIKTINPSLIVDSADFTESEIRAIQNQNIPPQAEKILKKLKISTSEAIKNIQEETLSPSPRINFQKTLYGGILIDARYYYHPTNLKSIIETTEAFLNPKILITTKSLNNEEKRYLEQKEISVNNKLPLNIEKEELIIIYDSKKLFNNEIDILTGKN